MEAMIAAHCNVARKLDELIGSFRRLRQEADRAQNPLGRLPILSLISHTTFEPSLTGFYRTSLDHCTMGMRL
jgi:hypothetical protein